MKKLLFFIVWIVIITGIVLVMLPWGVISSHYNKYQATKEPDKYSQCVVCKSWYPKKYTFNLNKKRHCDDCVVHERWRVTEEGEEYIGVWEQE